MPPLALGEGRVKASGGALRLEVGEVTSSSAAMLSPNCFWMMDEERLADLGALLVFRHWLRQQLEELAGEAADGMVLEPPSDSPEASYGRLFF